MKYQELIKEVEGVGKLKLSEQENFYRDVLNESSNDLEVMVAATFYLGMAYYYEGNSKKAQEYYSMSYDANCKESLYYLGILQKEAKEYDKAVKTFEKYIKEKKQDLTVDVYNRLASVYVEQGEYEKAQQALDKGFSYGSTDASQMLKKNQVLLYERQKKRTEAKKAAKEYMKLYPNEMKVYYETDDFVCYYIHQNVECLYNLAIDYGYNNPKEQEEE